MKSFLSFSDYKALNFLCIESFKIQSVIPLVSDLVWFGHSRDVPVVFHPCNLPITPIMETQSEVSKAISIISFLVLLTRTVGKKSIRTFRPPFGIISRGKKVRRNKWFLSYRFRHVLIKTLCRNISLFDVVVVLEKKKGGGEKERNPASCARTHFFHSL